MDVNKSRFCPCGKTLSSYKSLWRHQKTCCKGASTQFAPKKPGLGIDPDLVNRIINGTPIESESSPKVRKITPKNITSQTVAPMMKTATNNDNFNDIAKAFLEKPKQAKSRNLGTPKQAKSPITSIPKIVPKPGVKKILAPQDSSEDEPEPESEGSESETEVSSEVTEKKLVKVFNDLYSRIDEGDTAINNDLLILLKELKQRGCITKDEYRTVKARLRTKKQLNLYETIKSAIENITRDDQTQILHILRGMTKDERVGRVKELVKRYFEGEDLFEDISAALSALGGSMTQKLEAARVKVILNQIDSTKNRVRAVLTRLINTRDESNRAIVLNQLWGEDLITEKQHDKLAISPNSLSSISKIVQGGAYILTGNKTHT